MLSVIGAGSIDELFDEVPPALRTVSLAAVPPAMSESAVGRLMHQRAGADGGGICFLGGGAYDHHIPAAVWEVAARGEFYSAYTPYQAEASQGTLQVLYEYQTMMAHLTAMDVSNASLYDGASALAEAVLMAVRLARRNRARRILVPTTVHPAYRSVVRTLVHNQGIEVVELAYDETAGHLAPALLETIDGEDFAALVIPQPNYFGVLEEVHALTDWAHDQGLLVIAVVNPLLLSVLAPPGEWGATGADIVCGDGQPLGAPLSSGGPYFGFLTCKQAFVRQMPGRLVGRTVDQTGAPGFTLTLQAREQHIRRSKATSNICTNQGLMVTAATLHMAIMGAEGLRRTAAACHANCVGLAERLTAIEGVERVFHGDFGYELVLRLPVPARDVSRSLAAHNLLAGVVLEADYPELADCLLVCATEKRTAEDIESYGELLGRIIEHRLAAKCPVQPRL